MIEGAGRSPSPFGYRTREITDLVHGDNERILVDALKFGTIAIRKLLDRFEKGVPGSYAA